ncbi:MAG TPA: hypothetical protein VE951_06185 [Candidatus Angelobacter sp.]|jgi:Flp pilus assembly pilin Flp|nr:hypothetical protein [Candidatus Angelobacter sp.]
MSKWSVDRKRKAGQSMVEFALILCLVAMIAIVTLQVMGGELYKDYQDIQEAIQNPGDPGGQAPYSCPGGGTAVLHGHKYHCQ